MKAIMYHYVRDEPAEMPFFRYLHVDDFHAQLDFISETMGVVGKEDFLAALEKGVAPPGAVLTFDDGLADHHRFVLPALVERGLWGLFYIPADRHGKGTLLNVHRVHHLLGRYGGKEILGHLENLVSPEDIPAERQGEFDEDTYRQHDDDADTVRCKRMLNYFLPDDSRTRVLDRLMADLAGDERALCRAFYMSPDDLRDLDRAGMTLGGHGVTHRPLATLETAEQDQEIRESFEFIEGIAKPGGLRTFCYPYGVPNSFSPDTVRLLTRAHCRFSFVVDPRDITDDDLTNRPQILPRYDCNHFAFGKARNG
jgi:peptidoglycan/xylan/chitin deacetylase (PgdA/CDA1 family)